MRKIRLVSIVVLATLFITCDWFWMSQYFRGKVSTSMDCATSVKANISITILENKGLDTDSCTCHPFFTKNSLESSLLFGTLSSLKKNLLIGVPTVSRKTENYLHQTLESLISNINTEESSNVTIIVLFADYDAELRHQRAKKTSLEFSESITSGLLVLTQTFPELYPQVNITRRTFGDSLHRIKWRSKQVLDFAFLLTYSQTLSEYFLILEDDVITIPRFVTSIQNFVQEKKNSDWVSLTFSNFIIIGRLLKSVYLKRLAEFLLLFYLEKPVDLLISQFVDLLVPSERINTQRIPGLFQHMGLHSSLSGKIQKLKDKTFLEDSRDFENNSLDTATTLLPS